MCFGRPESIVISESTTQQICDSVAPEGAFSRRHSAQKRLCKSTFCSLAAPEGTAKLFAQHWSHKRQTERQVLSLTSFLSNKITQMMHLIL